MKNFTLNLLMIVLLLPACSAAMLPRVNDDLQLNAAANQGAAHDASRGFPIAFYANPGQDPETVEVSHGLGTIRFAGAQWVTELARQLNKAIAKVTLFDQRFAPISQQVFAYDVSDGDLSYAWREPVEGLSTGGMHMRIAKLRLDNFKTAATSEGVVATASVELNLGAYRQIYSCEKAGERWDREVFSCLGQKILGDASLWQAAQGMP